MKQFNDCPDYGMKRIGKSRFVIVAPHAAGYDVNTQYLAPKIAEKVEAFLIVNTKYHKKRSEDFNKLVWSKNCGSERKKEFYNDIRSFAELARSYAKKKAVIVFIHGMRNGRDKINIDIGCGLKTYNNKGKKELRATKTFGKIKKHPKSGKNKGIPRAKLKDMKALKKELENRGLKVGIGEAVRYSKKGGRIQFAAWSNLNGVQYKGTKQHYSFQLEIARKWRRLQKLEPISKKIAEALKSVYI